MKKLITVLFLFTFVWIFCQQIELKSVIDKSQIFKGAVSDIPFTIQLTYTGVVDCNQYQHFVEGWYYYDKYQKKIVLTGIYDNGTLYLYHFGNQQKQKSKLLKEKITSPQLLEKTNEIAQELHPKETLIFNPEKTDHKNIMGKFYSNNKTLDAQLFTGNNMIYRYNEYIMLPGNKKINTYDFIDKHGGNDLISYYSDEKGNRILLYFERSSNFNACGMCGASEGEKGYRVLYFTKTWNYKNYEEYMTESCLENIYDTKVIKSKDSKTIQYKISKTSTTPGYILLVDINKASVIKSR
ncbi:hypothetical protein N0B16_07875 [Chryseobacterium sp. GMJ5]|uniref:Uncharacterized protein n=1 Tax=Chryseobacterium gilvum TaxID=2976534 RepID=A0ABT2VWH4_9FLAO|nr:hypothetical protein [Chryseobacterium gilvum]MCU7614353.1 hypothetical protein [Chryseobacterium gilvum]